MKNFEPNVYDYVEKNTGRHVVKAVTTYEGKAVYAYAKCDPQDVFDFEFGKELAKRRLAIKIAEKRAAHNKEFAKFCRLDLAQLEQYKKKVKKMLTSAEVAYGNRMVDVTRLENEIAEMIAGANRK